MVYALINAIKTNRDPNLTMILEADTTAAFAIPVFHLLPRRIFLARISFRAITWVIILVLGAGFIGKFLDIYQIVSSYDSYLHVFGCFVCVFAGYEIAKAMTHDPKSITPIAAAVCGFGLSFFAAVTWEMFEFVCDQYFNGNTQNWAFAPGQDFLQKFPMIPQRYPIFDTMADLICGTLGSFVAGITLFIYLRRKNKKTKTTPVKNANENDKPKAIVK